MYLLNCHLQYITNDINLKKQVNAATMDSLTTTDDALLQIQKHAFLIMSYNTC